MRGTHGGRPGGMRRYRINGEVVHPKGRYELKPGDTVLVEDSGAGGYGDPRERAPHLIAADVAEGLVSPEAAARDYGYAG